MKLDRLMRDPALLPAFERALGVRTDAELKQLEMQGNIFTSTHFFTCISMCNLQPSYRAPPPGLFHFLASVCSPQPLHPTLNHSTLNGKLLTSRAYSSFSFSALRHFALLKTSDFLSGSPWMQTHTTIRDAECFPFCSATPDTTLSPQPHMHSHSLTPPTHGVFYGVQTFTRY